MIFSIRTSSIKIPELAVGLMAIRSLEAAIFSMGISRKSVNSMEIFTIPWEFPENLVNFRDLDLDLEI